MIMHQQNRTVLLLLSALTITLSVNFSAFGFTTTDANTAIDSFNNAFYVYNGGNSYFKANTSGGTADFWKYAEMIEMEVDAYWRTGNTAYRDKSTSLVVGFVSIHGTDWSSDTFNDDMMWMCLACIRVYQETGNTTYRTYAKNNFDTVYSRGYDGSLGGGIWWTTAKTYKNAAVNGQAAIVAYYLYQALGDSSYLTKAQNIYNWEHSHLFNSSTGAVYDGENANGTYVTTVFSYNQGTFIGATDYLGTLSDGELAANYEKNTDDASGGGILPNYGQGGDGGGFNGIFARWLMQFVNDQNLDSSYYYWMSCNANSAWNERRTSDNLSWNAWLTPTPSGTLASFDCSSTVVAMQVVPTPPPLSDWGNEGLWYGADGSMQLFAVSSSNTLHSTWQNGPGGAWGSWVDFGGNLKTPQVVVGQNPMGTMQAFCISSSNTVKTTTQSGVGGSWGSWSDLGSGVTLKNNSLALTVVGNGSMSLFAIGTDNHLKTTWQNGPGGSWSSWIDLGGSLSNSLVAALALDGRMQVFAVGLNSHLMTTWQATVGGGWVAWNDWGETFNGNAGSLALARSFSGYQWQLFGVTTTNTLQTTWQLSVGGTWSAWYDWGGTIHPGLGIGYATDGSMRLFAPASSGNTVKYIAQTSPGGVWGSWSDFGGFVNGRVVVGHNPIAGNIQIFTVGSDNHVKSMWENTPGGSWSVWTDYGDSIPGGF